MADDRRRGAALADAVVALEPVSADTVDLLVRWTLDPVAQGPYKQVPATTPAAVRRRLLDAVDRRYFLIRDAAAGVPLGRFYWRAWRFAPATPAVDWELNIIIADPARRGRGVGSATQRLATAHLLAQPETRSVFAYTHPENGAEERALVNAGLAYAGTVPSERYPVPDAAGCVLFTRARAPAARRAVAPSALEIVTASADGPEAATLMAALDDDLGARYPADAIHGMAADEVAGGRGLFLLARLAGRAVGCCALRPLGPGIGEIKRMFVRPDVRGRGVGRRLLAALEEAARARGRATLRLEAGTRQPEALALYEACGYRRVPRFGPYVADRYSLCYEKALAGA